MTKLSFITYDGKIHEVQAEDGSTLMEAATRNDVPGIEADCGGACACGTCHVYVEPEWQDASGLPNENEAAMLEFANDPQPNSRLACQIKISPALDGLTVRVPASQH